MFASIIRWVRKMLGLGLGLGMSRGGGVTTISVPLNVSAPELTGVPRDGEYATIYAGTWDRAITDYRYTVLIDGVAMTSFPQTTAEDAISFAWPTSAVDGVYTATQEASADSGATWSSAAAVELAPLFPSTVITAATRTITAARTSVSGTLPMTFDITGKRYSSDQWEYVVYDTDNVTELFRSTIPISDDELGSPYTPDWSGNVDPVPVPPIPDWSTLSGTPALLNLSLRLVSGDYLGGTGGTPTQGIASNWVSLTPTDVVLWTPADLTTAPKAWYDPDTLAGADGSNVSTITDLQGSFNATLASGTGPILHYNYLNGRKVLEFSKASLAKVTISSSLLNGATEGSFFALIKLKNDPPPDNGSNGDVGSILDCFTTDSQGSHHPYSNGAFYDTFGVSSRTAFGSLGKNMASTYRIVNVEITAAGVHTVRIDGVQQAQATGKTIAFGNVTRHLGWTTGDYFLNAYLVDLFVLDYVPSAAERYKIEGYALWSAGLESQLPSGHAYEFVAP